jgi:flagellar biosynthesis activator protein FlaF
VSTTGYEDMSLAETQAFRLTQCALALDRAKPDGNVTSDAPASNTPGKALAMALLDNLETWVAIKTFTESDECALDEMTRNNMARLCAYVFDKTFAFRDGVRPEVLNSLVNLNFQIAEGLLEGMAEKR